MVSAEYVLMFSNELGLKNATCGVTIILPAMPATSRVSAGDLIFARWDRTFQPRLPVAVCLQKWVCWFRDRFFWEHVQACADELAAPKRVLDGVKVGDLASCRVDEKSTVGKEVDELLRDHTTGLGGAGAVDGERSRPLEQLLDCAHPLDAKRLVDAVRQVRIEEDDVPSERLCSESCSCNRSLGQPAPGGKGRPGSPVPMRPSPKIPNVAPRMRETSGVSLTLHGAGGEFRCRLKALAGPKGTDG